MNITCLIPLLFALSLSACVSIEPQPEDFGEPVTLSSGCNELAGSYLNSSDRTKWITLRSILRIPNHPDWPKVEPQYVELSFPETGALRIDTHYYAGASGIAQSKTFLESKKEFECADGVLKFWGDQKNLVVSGPTDHGLGAGYGSWEYYLTITTKKYLQIRYSGVGAGIAFPPPLFIIPVPLVGKIESWYYFAPYKP